MLADESDSDHEPARRMNPTISLCPPADGRPQAVMRLMGDSRPPAVMRPMGDSRPPAVMRPMGDNRPPAVRKRPLAKDPSGKKRRRAGTASIGHDCGAILASDMTSGEESDNQTARSPAQCTLAPDLQSVSSGDDDRNSPSACTMSMSKNCIASLAPELSSDEEIGESIPRSPGNPIVRLDSLEDVFRWPFRLWIALRSVVGETQLRLVGAKFPKRTSSFFSGIGTAEIGWQLLSAWVEHMTGSKACTTIDSMCDSSPVCRQVLLDQGLDTCVFGDLLGRLKDLPGDLVQNGRLDFTQAEHVFIQNTII